MAQVPESANAATSDGGGSTPAQHAEADRQAAARAEQVVVADTSAGKIAGAAHAEQVNQADLDAAQNIASQQQQAAQQSRSGSSGASPSSSTSSSSGSGGGASTPATPNPNAQSAVEEIQALFAQVPGLATVDPNGLLAAWTSSEAQILAGQGLSGDQIATQIESIINNPAATGDTATQTVFDTLFPGYNQKIQSGTTNADGSYTGLAGYIQYSAQIQQFATQTGLVSGTITQQDIGNLWAGNVSTSEVSQRITAATVDATSMPQQVQDYLSTNFGMTPGALVSYYLNPANTLQTIGTNMNTATVGGAASITGFDQNLSKAQSSALGAFLATTSGGSSNQIGGVNQVSIGSATNAFQSSLGPSTASGTELGSAAALAQGGFESALPGQVAGGPGVLSENQILGAVEGNAGSIAAVDRAAQTRTAGAKGGGGATTTAEGAVGLGFANS